MENTSAAISNIKESRKTTTSIVEIFLLVGILVIVAWFLVKPKYEQNKSLRNNLNTIQSEKATAENEIAELQTLVGKLKTSSDNLKLVDEALPLNGRVTKLQALVENLTISSGMQLSFMELSNSGNLVSAGNKNALSDPYGQNRELRTDQLSVSLTGTIDQFKNFLQLLETSSRIIDISDFQISREVDSLKFSMKIKAYAYEINKP